MSSYLTLFDYHGFDFLLFFNRFFMIKYPFVFILKKRYNYMDIFGSLVIKSSHDYLVQKFSKGKEMR